MINNKKWTTNSWLEKPAKQLPVYLDHEKNSHVISELSALPSLVEAESIDNLIALLAKACRGEYFFIQSGDCAERFSDCSNYITQRKMLHIFQMGDILSKNLNMPIIYIGRLAGQYSKPRSVESETIHEITLPVYKGDMINCHEFTAAARRHDPERMLTAYQCAKIIIDTLKITPIQNRIYTSHEALHLPYEAALTRYNNKKNKWYNYSTHFPWIGMRTALYGYAHLEYLRGISNPIGIKIGNVNQLSEIKKILSLLNPENVPGRITLIHRFSAHNIQDFLPRLLDEILDSNQKVVWCCDPMHGNTQLVGDIKTRSMEDIINTLFKAVDLHYKFGTTLAGLHLEATHEDVTECITDKTKFQESWLQQNYTSLVDPRLNAKQSFEVVELFSSYYKRFFQKLAFG